VRARGSILTFALLVLALLFVAGPLALMGRGELQALQAALAERQANDLVDLALAQAGRTVPAWTARTRCPRPGSADWRFREVRITDRPLGGYALLPLRSRRGRGVWCVAARTAGGPLNEGQRVEVYYRVVTDARGRELRREVLR